MPENMNKIEISEEVQKRDKANLKKLLEIAETMIIRFSNDKLNVSENELKSFIDQADVDVDYELVKENKINGYYQNGYIRINPSIIYEISSKMSESMCIDIISSIGSIIHEFGHKFSKELSKGFISLQSDEAFSSIFADECIGYFLETCPEKLEKFGFNMEAIYKISNLYKNGKFIICRNAYSGENDFTRLTLELIRQKKGDAYRAEYENIFGNKAKYLEILEENLGKNYIGILKLQSTDYNLGNKYNMEYNRILFDLVKDFPFKYEEYTEDSRRNVFLIGERMLQDIMFINAIKEDANKSGKDIYDIHPEDVLWLNFNMALHMEKFRSNNIRRFQEDILRGYFKNCRDLNEVSQVDFTVFKGISPVSILAENEKFSIRDLLEFMKNNMEYYIPKNGKIEERICKEINISDIKNLSKTEMETIIKFVLALEKHPNEKLENIVNEIGQVMPDKTLYNQTEIDLAELNVSKTYKPMKMDTLESTLLIEKIAENLKSMDKEDTIPQQVDEFKKYLQNNAKKDIDFLKKILSDLQNYEMEIKQRQDKSNASIKLFEGLRLAYFETLRKDVNFLTENGFTVSEDYKKYLETEELCGIPSNCYPEIGSKTGINELLLADDNTNLINVFNKKNLEKIFERDGMVTIKTNLYFNNQYMDEEQMKIYVGALTDSLENLTEFNSVNNIFILWRNVDREYSPVYEEDIKIKRNFWDKIGEQINRMDNPEMSILDLYTVYGDLIKDHPIYAKVVESLERRINDNELDEIDDGNLELLYSSSKEDTYLQDLALEGLTKKYRQYNYTTEQFIKKDSLWEKDLEIKAYVRSIGKENDPIQEKALKTLKRLCLYEDCVPTCPQYIKLSDNDFVIISNDKNNFGVFTSKGKKDEELSQIKDQMNKRKKGIFSLLKTKEEKELLEHVIILEEGTKEKKVLNVYESGRLEIATLDLSRKFRVPKFINKVQVRADDIGNNGGLIVASPPISRKFLKYHAKIEDKNNANKTKFLEYDDMPR